MLKSLPEVLASQVVSVIAQQQQRNRVSSIGNFALQILMAFAGAPPHVADSWQWS